MKPLNYKFCVSTLFSMLKIKSFLFFFFPSFSLNILVSPKFTPPPSATVVGIEDESLIINLMANGNPTNIQYTWTKEGSPLDHGMISFIYIYNQATG